MGPAPNSGGPVAPPSWFQLGTDIVAVVLPASTAAAPGLHLRLDEGQPFPPVSQLPLADGGTLLLARARGGRVLCLQQDSDAWVSLGEATTPALPEAARSPRLLALLASKATGPLRAAADPALARSLIELARPLAQAAPDSLRPLVGLGQGRALWRLHAGGWLLTARGLLRIADAEANLILLPAEAAGALLLRGDAPPLLLPAEFPPPPGLLDLAREAGAASSPLLRQALHALRGHTAEPWCQDAVRNAQLLTMAPARAAAETSSAVAAAIDRAISDQDGGVFLVGWLHDPLHLVRGISLRGPFGATPVPLDSLFRVSRPDVVKRFEQAPFGGADTRPGFVVHLPHVGPGPVAQWRLVLALGSGEMIELVAGPALIPATQAGKRCCAASIRWMSAPNCWTAA